MSDEDLLIEGERHPVYRVIVFKTEDGKTFEEIRDYGDPAEAAVFRDAMRENGYRTRVWRASKFELLSDEEMSQRTPTFRSRTRC